MLHCPLMQLAGSVSLCVTLSFGMQHGLRKSESSGMISWRGEASLQCLNARLCAYVGCVSMCVCVCVCTVPKPMECDHAPPPPPPIVPGEGCTPPPPHPICYTLAEHKPICGKPLFCPAISSGFSPPLRMLIAPYPLESALPRIEKAEG